MILSIELPNTVSKYRNNAQRSRITAHKHSDQDSLACGVPPCLNKQHDWASLVHPSTRNCRLPDSILHRLSTAEWRNKDKDNCLNFRRSGPAITCCAGAIAIVVQAIPATTSH